jgi:serine/threonine-protein kinase
MAEETLQTELEPGYQIGEYRIEKKLGEGGFGAVYRAVHPLIGKAAAIKVLHRQYSSNPEMVARFVAEAKAVNQIRQRNIIDIFSFGALPDGRQYYIMELLEGMTFDEYLRQHLLLTPEVALPILRQIAKALDAAHASGIAHRDLKPENIFLVIEGDGVIFPKLLDFGIAKLLHDDGEQGGSVKTRTGTPMGTPYFMSPEQCRGLHVDHRTDIYSFGVMTFKVLTGKLPFDAEVVVDLLFKHLSEPPPRPSAVYPGLSPAFDEPILRMLEKDPNQRPSTVSMAVDGLLQAAVNAGIPLSIPGVTLPAPTASVPTADLPNARTISSPDAHRIPGASTTLPTADPPRRPAPLLAVIGGAALLLLGGLAFLLRPSEAPATPATGTAPPPEPPPASAAPSNPAPEPVASVVPVASAQASEHIELTIQEAPPSTAIFLGALKLGMAPGPLRLKRGDAPLKLTLKAPGHTPQTIEFVPAASGSLEAKLTKVRGPSKPGPGSGPGDLERPY